MFLWVLLQDPGQFDPKWEDVVKGAAARVSEQAVQDIISAPRGKLVIIPLAGDQGKERNLVTEELRAAVMATGKFEPPDKDWWDWVLDKIGRGKIENFNSLEKAVEVGLAAKADYVLFGRTVIDGRFPPRFVVTLHFRIVDVKTKKGFFIGSYSTREEKSILSTAQWKVWMRDKSVAGRLVIWFVVMLVMPFIVLAFKEAASGTRPLLPVMMIVAFTAIDVFLSFSFLGFDIDSVMSAGVFVVSMVMSLFWNLYVLTKISQIGDHGV